MDVGQVAWMEAVPKPRQTVSVKIANIQVGQDYAKAAADTDAVYAGAAATATKLSHPDRRPEQLHIPIIATARPAIFYA